MSDSAADSGRAAARVEALSKRYGDRDALSEVDLEIATGQCFGLFGHNGSGKTTLLKILAGLIQPTSGHASVAGFELPKQAASVRRATSVLLDAPFIPRDFTLREGLHYYADLYSQGVSNEAIDEVAERVGLAWRLRDPIRTFSRGMGQRASLACVLLTTPEVLILDEPFTGLDREGCGLVERIIGETVESGRTVILVTHELERGARLCRDVAVLRQGRLVLSGGEGEWSDDQLVEALG